MSAEEQLNKRKTFGISLLIISLIAWAALPVIPFLPLSSASKAAWGAGVFIFAEIIWWLGVPLLGPEFIVFFKKLWKKVVGVFVKVPEKEDIPEQN